MLKINESVTAFDVAEVLQDESGIFEAVSPQGEKYQLICRSGRSITNFRPLEHHRGKGPQGHAGRVRRVGKLRLEQEAAYGWVPGDRRAVARREPAFF